MLRAMGMIKEADSIEFSVAKTLREGKWLTGDLGGKAKCTEFT